MHTYPNATAHAPPHASRTHLEVLPAGVPAEASDQHAVASPFTPWRSRITCIEPAVVASPAAVATFARWLGKFYTNSAAKEHTAVHICKDSANDVVDVSYEAAMAMAAECNRAKTWKQCEQSNSS